MPTTITIDDILLEAADTRCIRIGTGLLGSVVNLLEHYFEHHQSVVVADENTFAAAGKAVSDQLRAGGKLSRDPIIFPATVYANFDNVLVLEEVLRARNAVPIVVGSGTLNDLMKLASYRAGLPYMCVATAASMDGYTAFGSAITKAGFKQTMACPAPRVVLADLDVLVRAPPQLRASGYGDLLGKITAGADWLLADALDIEAIDRRAWPLVQDSLRTWTGQPEQLREGNPQAIAQLFEGLVMAGLAMQLCASSRPASGSEHRFSHLWEMQAVDQGLPGTFHGFKVGVGTLAAAALYEQLLTHDLTNLDVERLCQDWPSRSAIESAVRRAHDNSRVAEHAVAESLAKYIDSGQLRQRLELLRRRWPEIRERLQAQLLPAEQLKRQLQAAGCPVVPTEIGVSWSQLKESYDLARTIRARYTVLDLVAETGLLTECVDALFAPDGFWGRMMYAQGP